MKKILLLEDNWDYRHIMTDALTQGGFFVISASNGEEGLKRAKEGTIDLVLLDMHMPKMDGVTFYYRFMHVLKEQVPLIVLTNDTETTAYGPEIKEVLMKTQVTPEEVVKVVKKYLG